jgi:Fe2+ transport system protein FeoA
MSDATDQTPPLKVVNGECRHSDVCPLSHLEPGVCARIRELAGADAFLNDRLRELGFCEDQQVKILSRGGNLICQVCNARLGLSEQLAANILVEKVAAGSRR